MKTEINQARKDGYTNNTVKLHCNYLKEYIGHVKGYKTRQNIDLDYREKGVKYTRDSIWKFTAMLWNRRTIPGDEDTDFTITISRNTRHLPCNRTTESFLYSALLNRLPLYDFLYNRNLMDSPYCPCKEEKETVNHVLFECTDFFLDRQNLNVIGCDIEEYFRNNTDIEPLCNLAALVYSRRNINQRYKLFESSGTNSNNKDRAGKSAEQITSS